MAVTAFPRSTLLVGRFTMGPSDRPPPDRVPSDAPTILEDHDFDAAPSPTSKQRVCPTMDNFSPLTLPAIQYHPSSSMSSMSSGGRVSRPLDWPFIPPPAEVESLLWSLGPIYGTLAVGPSPPTNRACFSMCRQSLHTRSATPKPGCCTGRPRCENQTTDARNAHLTGLLGAQADPTARLRPSAAHVIRRRSAISVRAFSARRTASLGG